ncbi:UPF0547 protein C16orf87 homolog isoform X2 [Mixophyes fleayi]|uniref:UPF0547 protein C16orf87 homolog isoform X2 n=1 Tax=Mixophyes fleayi TaxID=3061075 RepID=UPI003F4D8B79
MSLARAKKVKMATKSCPQCDQQVPVACKSCPCGYIFISRKLLHARQTERLTPTSDRSSLNDRSMYRTKKPRLAERLQTFSLLHTENRSDPKRRRTERIKRERIISTVSRDLENRRRSRSNSQSDPTRRGRGRPKAAATKRLEEEKARIGRETGVDRPASRNGEDSRVQRGDRGSRRQLWIGEEKQEKEVDMYANLSDEKAFVFSVALAEINRKILNQRLIL